MKEDTKHRKDFLTDQKMESLETLITEEFTNIIRICDICGEEMILNETFSSDHSVFICHECGYHLRVAAK